MPTNAQQQSYYRILHLLDHNPEALVYKQQLATLFNQLGVVEPTVPSVIRDTTPYAQRIGSLQATQSPYDLQGQGFVSGNKINTGGIEGQVTDESSMNSDQIGAPLKEVISGTIGATLLTHLANLRETLLRLTMAYDDRIKKDELSNKDILTYERLKDTEKKLAAQQLIVENAVADIADEHDQYFTLPQPQPRPSLGKKIEHLLEADATLHALLPSIKSDVKTIGALLRTHTDSVENTIKRDTHQLVKDVEDHIDSPSPFDIPSPGQTPTLKPW